MITEIGEAKAEFGLNNFYFPILEDRLNNFFKFKGGIYFHSDEEYLGSLLPFPVCSEVSIRSDLGLADRIVVLYHELSHFTFKLWYVDPLLEEVRCHSEMFMFYLEEVKPKGLFAKQVEVRMSMIKEVGLVNYVQHVYKGKPGYGTGPRPKRRLT